MGLGVLYPLGSGAASPGVCRCGSCCEGGVGPVQAGGQDPDMQGPTALLVWVCACTLGSGCALVALPLAVPAPVPGHDRGGGRQGVGCVPRWPPSVQGGGRGRAARAVPQEEHAGRVLQAHRVQRAGDERGRRRVPVLPEGVCAAAQTWGRRRACKVPTDSPLGPGSSPRGAHVRVWTASPLVSRAVFCVTPLPTAGPWGAFSLGASCPGFSSCAGWFTEAPLLALSSPRVSVSVVRAGLSRGTTVCARSAGAVVLTTAWRGAGDGGTRDAQTRGEMLAEESAAKWVDDAWVAA